MRYYNENPQVGHWREKYEKLQSLYDFACKYNSLLVENYNLTHELMRKFDKLPWYKKMFYRFEV